MSPLLVIALLGTGIFVGVCNAACMFIQPKGSVNGDPGGCEYRGEIHAYGSSWRTDDCLNCDCDGDGSIECCDVGGRPVQYDKEKCIAIFDKKTCLYSVVRKNNRKKECPHAMVG